MNKKKCIELLKRCLVVIKSYHSPEYCPTTECYACELREDIEELLRKKEKQ